MAFSGNKKKTTSHFSANDLVFSPVDYTENPQIRDDSFVRVTMSVGEKRIGTTRIATDVYSAMLSLGQNVGLMSEEKVLPYYVSSLFYEQMLQKGNGLPKDHPHQEHVTQRFHELLSIVDLQAKSTLPDNVRAFVRKKIKNIVSPG